MTKSTFSVARITTTSFVAAMFALTGCDVGLQADGTADLNVIIDGLEEELLVEDHEVDHHEGEHHEADAEEADHADHADEDEAAQDAPKDEDPLGDAEPHAQWTSMVYGPSSKAGFEIYGDIESGPDGTIHSYLAVSVGDEAVNFELRGGWEAHGEQMSVSMAGSTGAESESRMTARAGDLLIGGDCSYAQGGVLTVSSPESTVEFHFSRACDSCFEVVADGVALGQVCTD